jgi:glutamate racemase
VSIQVPGTFIEDFKAKSGPQSSSALGQTAFSEVPGASSPQGAIGVFDSGVGGLSVMREIAKQLPHEDILYFADSVHCPYGPRPLEEVRKLSEAITAFLIQQGAKIVVVACNTASAASLHHLRATFPVPIVGMEPAIKPAVERTRSKKVGVIATQVTFQGELFARLVERFAADVDVYTQVCPGLVERVEAGLIEDAETEELLADYLKPMLEAGIDSLVLGCTHYPFLRKTIERVVGPRVTVIDPSQAVARQTGRVLEREGLANRTDRVGKHFFYTSGDPMMFAEMMERLVRERGEVQQVIGGFEFLRFEFRVSHPATRISKLATPNSSR